MRLHGPRFRRPAPQGAGTARGAGARRWAVLGVGLSLIVGLVVLSQMSWTGSPSGTPRPPAASTPSGTPNTGQPQARSNCTKEANNAVAMRQALDAAAPGDRICLDGDMGEARLSINRSGQPNQPIVVLGGGATITRGITVEASHVLIDGVRAQDPEAPGIDLSGTSLTVQNSAVISPRGGDGDGIRFWGQDIKILRNLVSDTRGRVENHADAIQTYATDPEHPASQDVVIDGNRFERIDNICLIAEGPNSEAGDGSGEGQSSNFVFSNNYCDNGAGQAVFVDDVSKVSVTNNEITGGIDKAFAFQNGATGATVNGNKLNPAIGYEVGMDDSSTDGYQGPEPGGQP